MNQQGNCGQNHFGQPMQQDQLFGYNQQQQQNSCAQNPQSVSMNPSCLCAPGMGQPQVIPCSNYLPQNIIEQIRSCVGNAAPIFILPNSQPIQTQLPQVQQNPPPQVNMYPNIPYPSSMTSGYPGMPSGPLLPPPCYPFPVPFPVCNAFGNQNRSQSERNSMSCDCCRRNNNSGGNSGQSRNPGTPEEGEVHRCSPGNDDTICAKPNCPASINLQALASQLLSLQGVIPCAATRLVLRKVPGSNVTTTVEDTMDRAQKSIGLLNKDQLITEARNAQHVNGLINLHMTSNPPQNIIPALTMLQLKVNSLKALVENLINKSVSECQSVGAEGNTNLEPMILAIKSDAELRELLAILRQKECEERVNVNYAPYHSQRVVAESRLSNFQNKISQVETEMEKRRAVAMPWLHSNAQFHQESFFKGGNCRNTLQDSHCNDPRGLNPIFNQSQAKDAGGKGFDSPSPFMVQVQNPRRLNLKPNVGGPQTTYDHPEEERVLTSQIGRSEKNGQGCCKDGESWDQENAEPSKEAPGLNEGKKKLKIHIDDKGELSVKKKSLEELGVGEFVELSPDVVIVIDKGLQGSKDEDRSQNKSKKKKNQKTKSGKKKSAESIPSDSSYESKSETSVSSKSSDPEEKPEDRRLGNKRSKSILKNVSKEKKKTSTSEEDIGEKTSLDVPDKNESIKEEKHVSVAMVVSEICKDKFDSKNEIDGHGSELTTLEKCSEPSSFEEHESRNQERLDVIRENAYDLETFYYPPINGQAASKELCSLMRDASNNSVISYRGKSLTPKNSSANNLQSLKILSHRDSNVEGNSRSRRSVKSKRFEEGEDQTVDRLDRSTAMEGSKEKLKKGGQSCDKENVSHRTRPCSIKAKGINREMESPEGSISNSVNSIDLDHRKRWNHRFK